MKAPSVLSVIIPSYNYAHFLPYTLESVQKQRSSLFELEIIVVDDGSTDDTSRLALSFPENIVYVRTANQGLPRARNTGLSLAHGDCVLFLDADDLLPAGVLESQYTFLNTHQDIDIAVCFSFQMRAGEEGGYFWPLRADCFDVHLCYKVFSPIHTCLVRSRVLSEVGGFAPQFSACEDHDFWLRCAQKKKRFGINYDGLVVYRLHEKSMSARKEQNVRRKAALLCDLTSKFLLENRDFPLRGRKAALLAHAANALALSSALSPYDRACADNLNRLASEALRCAGSVTEETADHYLTASTLFYASRVLLLTHPLRDDLVLRSQLAELRACFPELAGLSLSELERFSRKLDLSLNCDFSCMQRAFQRYPDVRL